MKVGIYSTVDAYYFSKYFQPARTFLEKEEKTSLVRFKKTKQSAKAKINNIKVH